MIEGKGRRWFMYLYPFKVWLAALHATGDVKGGGGSK